MLLRTIAIAIAVTGALTLALGEADACSIDGNPYSVYPTDTTSGVPTDSLIWFTHADSPDAAEINLFAADDTSQPLDVESVSVAGLDGLNIYALRPLQELTPGTTYIVKGRNSFSDAEGRSWTFTTGAGPGAGDVPKLDSLEYFHASHPGAELALGCGVMADSTAAFATQVQSNSPMWFHRLTLETASGNIERAWQGPRGQTTEFGAFALQDITEPMCVSVTVSDIFGQTSEAMRTCTPDKCVALNPSDDYTAFHKLETWESVGACGENENENGDEDAGGGCSVASSSTKHQAPLALLALALCMVFRRRHRSHSER